MTDLSHPASLPAADQFMELRQRVENEYQSRFGRVPSVVAAAPGRVNLIGEHIDYNNGFVLPMAIERYVIIAAAPCSDPSHEHAIFYSSDLQESTDIPIGASFGPTCSGWGRYVEGVVAGFVSRGCDVPPLEAVIGSSVPSGGGLSSSAALEVATATMLEGITDHQIEPLEKAILCQHAEHAFAGMPCGIMDQFSSVFGMPGELMLLDCMSQEIQVVPFREEDVSVLITNSNIKHELTGGEYAERRRQCESALEKLDLLSWRDVRLADLEAARDRLNDDELACGRHVVTEIARTLDAAKAFSNGQWALVGELMYSSHESLQKDFRVSCDELDALVRITREIGSEGGVYGSRMTGGGFGGCIVTLVHSDCASAVRERILTQYENETGVQGSSFASRPALGAHLIKRNGNDN
ncbi:MAG: galactokinase [Planctomycetes bacterium]|nr:galactokinase [Planctomycetota bacterium]